MSHPLAKPAPMPASKRGAICDNANFTTTLLLDSTETAIALRISPRKLWDLTDRNAVPHIRIDGCLRYSIDELRAWINAGAPTKPGSADAVRKGVQS